MPEAETVDDDIVDSSASSTAVELYDPDAGTVSSRCSICDKLPDPYRKLVLELKFDYDLSDPQIADQINRRLGDDGEAMRITPRSLHRHFTTHGTSGQRAVYRLRSNPTHVPADVRELGAAPEVLSSSSPLMVLLEKLAFQVELHEDAQDRIGAKMIGDDGVIDSKMFKDWLAAGKAILASYEAVRRTVDPRKLVELYLARVLHEYTNAMTTHSVSFVENLGKALEQRVHDDATIAVIRDLVREHGRAFATRFSDTARFYEGQLSKLTAEQT